MEAALDKAAITTEAVVAYLLANPREIQVVRDALHAAEVRVAQSWEARYGDHRFGRWVTGPDSEWAEVEQEAGGRRWRWSVHPDVLYGMGPNAGFAATRYDAMAAADAVLKADGVHVFDDPLTDEQVEELREEEIERAAKGAS